MKSWFNYNRRFLNGGVRINFRQLLSNELLSKWQVIKVVDNLHQLLRIFKSDTNGNDCAELLCTYNTVYTVQTACVNLLGLNIGELVQCASMPSIMSSIRINLQSWWCHDDTSTSYKLEENKLSAPEHSQFNKIIDQYVTHYYYYKSIKRVHTAVFIKTYILPY